MAIVLQDPALILLEAFHHHRQQHHSTDEEAFSYAIATHPQMWNEVSNRSHWVGEIPAINFGDEFRYRNELRLAGLHDDRYRGICIGPFYSLLHDAYFDVATCVVAKYPLHNYHLEQNVLVYGGEGGQIAQAHAQNVRVIRHQRWSPGNIALEACLQLDNPIRTVVRRLRDDDQARYVYEGLFKLISHEVVITPEGLVVHEFILELVMVD